jgi:hypothetical protein
MRVLLCGLIRIVPACLVVVIAGNATAADITVKSRTDCTVTAPPRALVFKPFYKKYCSAEGIPIASSAQVPDSALQKAAEIMTHMLALIPAVRSELVRSKVRVAILGVDEKTTDIPEYKKLPETNPGKDWDSDRGIAATEAILVSSGAEENLLCYPADRDTYHGENIFVHEFGHTIKEIGIEKIDRKFRRKVQEAYKEAEKLGLWEGHMMHNGMTNDPIKYAEEYWAEGVQYYFGVNRDKKYNDRDEFKKHDAKLFDLIDLAFNHAAWRANGCS